MHFPIFGVELPLCADVLLEGDVVIVEFAQESEFFEADVKEAG